MTTVTPIYTNDHVGGGWTEAGTVARRICTELWKATGTFTRITEYHSDVIIDYEVIRRSIENLGPGKAVPFAYAVGANGTHLYGGTDTAMTKFVLTDDRGANTARFIFTVARSEWRTDSVTKARYGADRYTLVIVPHEQL